MARFGSAFGGFASGLDAGREFQLKQQERADLQAATQAKNENDKLNQLNDAWDQGVGRLLDAKKNGLDLPSSAVDYLIPIADALDKQSGTNHFTSSLKGIIETPVKEASPAFGTTSVYDTAINEVTGEPYGPRILTNQDFATLSKESPHRFQPYEKPDLKSRFVRVGDGIYDLVEEEWTLEPKSEFVTIYHKEFYNPDLKDADRMMTVPAEKLGNYLDNYVGEKPPEPKTMMVTLKGTNTRELVRVSDYDSNIHTDAQLSDNRPAQITKYTVEDGIEYEQEHLLKDGVYVAFGDKKRISPKKYEWTELKNDPGKYIRRDPTNNDQIIVDLSDISEEDRAKITARAKLASAAIEGKAKGILTVAEKRAILESGIIEDEARAKALADLDVAPIVAETKVTIEKALNDPDLLSHIALAEAVAADAAAELRGEAKGKEAAAAVKFNQITYHPTDIPGLYKEEKPNGEVTLKWLDADAKGRWSRDQAMRDALNSIYLAEWEGEAQAEREMARIQTFADQMELTWKEAAIELGFIKEYERKMRLGADGYLYYTDGEQERVFPNIEKDPKAYSSIVLFNTNAKEGEDQWTAFNRNEDQDKINEYIKQGWIPTSISIASENAGSLLSDREIVQEIQEGDEASEILAQVADLYDQMETLGRGAVGITGKATEWLAKSLGVFSPNMEEALIRTVTGRDTTEFYRFRTDLKRLGMNLVDVYTGEEHGKYTDIERDMAQRAASLDVGNATAASVRATLESLFTLSLISKMRSEYSMHRNNPNTVPFQMDAMSPDNGQQVATYILDATGYRENGDDKTVTNSEMESVKRILADLIQFQTIAGFKNLSK